MNKEPKTAPAAAPARINWPEIHRRLDEIRAVLLETAVPPPETRKRILRARAKALATEPKPEAPHEERLDLLEFLLAYERYALESAFAIEVYPLKELTPLPGAPPFARGIINVRGRMVCVVDLKTFFDLPEKGLTDLNKVIIIGDGRREFGLLADAVTGVCRVARQAIQPSLPTLTGVRLEYLKGVTVDRLVILDAAKILADPRLTIRRETSAGG